MSTKESHQQLKSMTAETTNQDLIEIYRSWSKTYDEDVAKDLLYAAPHNAAVHLSQKLEEHGFDKNARILDLGCGTGMVGEELSKVGLTSVDGVDISPESIEIAKSKNVYKSLSCGFMGSKGCKDLGIDPNQYHAAICIGVFTVGHVKGNGFDDLVHVVKPGGLACFTVRECVANDPQYGYNEKMKELCDTKKWKLVSKTNIIYQARNDFKSWLYVYEVL